MASRPAFPPRRFLVAALALASCTRVTPLPAPQPAPVSAQPATQPATQPAPSAAPLDFSRPLTERERHWVDSTLASLTLRERVGQLVWRWVLGDYASTTDTSYARALEEVRVHGIGGITMSLGSPIETAAKINSLQRAARVPLIVASDLEPGLGRLEGGVFTHYMMEAGGATVFPNAMAIAATGREEDAFDVARVIAEEASAVGMHVNFAPTVDVNNNPSNPVINTRSFGEDPDRVARLSALFVRGTLAGGMVPTAKHFPGHGDTDVDSHVGMPIVAATRSRLDTLELVPFRASIAAGVPMVMTAHLALPAVTGDSATPATLAPAIMTGLLRDDLGFRGVTVSDALTMEGVGRGYSAEESAVLAIKAGVEVLLMPRDTKRAVDGVVAAVERGEIPREQVDAAARHVLEMKARTGAAFKRHADLEALRTVVGAGEHRAMADAIAARAVTLLRDSAGLVPVPASAAKVVVVQYMPETELKAGRRFAAEVQRSIRGARVVKITPRSGRAELDSIAAMARGADRVILTAYVRRVEGEGRVAIPESIAKWMNEIVASETAVFISLGNPYLIRQVPGAKAYMVTYGVGDALERAAARAVLGQAPISGRSPVSLPGFFRMGDGLTR
jgi:beta-N-acetylhexosaminidase